MLPAHLSRYWGERGILVSCIFQFPPKTWIIFTLRRHKTQLLFFTSRKSRLTRLSGQAQCPCPPGHRDPERGRVQQAAAPSGGRSGVAGRRVGAENREAVPGVPALPARSRSARSAPLAALPAPRHFLPSVPAPPALVRARRLPPAARRPRRCPRPGRVATLPAAPRAALSRAGRAGEATRCPPPRARAPRPGEAAVAPGPGAGGAPGWAPSGGS